MRSILPTAILGCLLFSSSLLADDVYNGFVAADEESRLQWAKSVVEIFAPSDYEPDRRERMAHYVVKCVMDEYTPDAGQAFDDFAQVCIMKSIADVK